MLLLIPSCVLYTNWPINTISYAHLDADGTRNVQMCRYDIEPEQ